MTHARDSSSDTMKQQLLCSAIFNSWIGSMGESDSLAPYFREFEVLLLFKLPATLALSFALITLLSCNDFWVLILAVLGCRAPPIFLKPGKLMYTCLNSVPNKFLSTVSFVISILFCRTDSRIRNVALICGSMSSA